MAKKSFKAEKPAKDYFLTPQVEKEAKQEAELYGQAPAQARRTSPGKIRTGTAKSGSQPRKNIALEPANLDYLLQVSKEEGVSLSAYINRLITADRLS